jgi:transcriptional regulator with XRE-family HTH domain
MSHAQRLSDGLLLLHQWDWNMRSPLARAIREARLSVRLTQTALARYIGLKGRAVYRWERGDSLPRKPVRSLLIRVIQIRSGEAAAKLAAAFESHAARVKGLVEAAPAPATPPAKPSGSLALELAIFAMADELDLAPRRLRASLPRLFARVAEAGYSLDSARHEVEVRVSGTYEAPGASG